MHIIKLYYIVARHVNGSVSINIALRAYHTRAISPVSYSLYALYNT